MKKTILTIAIIILIALLGLVAYQWFNNDNEKVDVIDENVEINNESYEGKNFTIDKLNYLSDSNKIDSTKPFVYFIAPLYDDAEFEGQKVKQFRNEFVMYNNEDFIYSFPYFNIKIDGIDKINYMLKAYTLVSSTSQEIQAYNFKANVFDDILSLQIDQISSPYYKIGINIDLKNKKILSLEDILAKKNLTHDDILEELQKEVDKIISDNDIDRYTEKTAEDMLKRLLITANNDYRIYNTKINLKKDLNYYAQRISFKDLGYTDIQGFDVHDWELSKEYYEELSKQHGINDWPYSYSFVNDMANNDRLCYFIDKDNNLNIYLNKYWSFEIDSLDTFKLIIK